MVLCRGKELRIFGEGSEGARVLARLGGREASAVVRNGRFLIHLPPMEAQTGLALILTDGETVIEYRNVAVGEVYLAGGQSNMELELQNADEGPARIASHNDPDLRFYSVPKQAVREDKDCVSEGITRWVTARPGACGDVSAVAYFFAVRLRERLNVPVGIVNCYWGGTSASCWIDEEGLNRTDAGQHYLSAYRALAGDKTVEQYDREMEAYNAEYQAWCARVDALREKEPNIPWVRINLEVGVCPWPQPAGPKSPFRPAGLVETMLKRIVPLALTGILYYQGEEDVSRASMYEALLSSLILRWRELFRDRELPFLNVQLPMFIANGEKDDGAWAVIRNAQANVWRSIRNTGLVVLIDLGEFDNIHPTGKRAVGERLYEQALEVVYGFEANHSPRALDKYTEGDVLVVRLSAEVFDRGEGDALFEVAAENGDFLKAKYEIDGDRLRLWTHDLSAPIKARYAHVNFAKVRIMGVNGLPLAPFELP